MDLERSQHLLTVIESFRSNTAVIHIRFGAEGALKPDQPAVFEGKEGVSLKMPNRVLNALTSFYMACGELVWFTGFTLPDDIQATVVQNGDLLDRFEKVSVALIDQTPRLELTILGVRGILVPTRAVSLRSYIYEVEKIRFL